MKAIRVKVNFTTGERAGGINPRDKNLRCSPLWQNLEAGVEIRAVLDGDVSRYAALEGVEILDGEAAIDVAVADLHKVASEDHSVYNQALLAESIRSKKIKIDDIPADLSEAEEAKILFERGALGIRKATKPTPPKACDVCTFIPKLGRNPTASSGVPKRKPSR